MNSRGNNSDRKTTNHGKNKDPRKEPFSHDKGITVNKNDDIEVI
jgi:hypothetical protein